jgi:hypothetical protein
MLTSVESLGRFSNLEYKDENVSVDCQDSVQIRKEEYRVIEDEKTRIHSDLKC